MKKEIIVVVVILIVLGLVFFNESEIKEVCFENGCFEVELAISYEERSQGLMYREQLDGGMLFVFPEEGVYSFWMKNTLIPLDMIWISEDLGVVDIYENALPCITEVCESYGPTTEALYVLEINSGEVSEFGISIGERVSFS